MGSRFLHNLLCKNFHGRRPRPVRARLRLEPLEDRTVPSFLAPVDYAAGDGRTLAAGDFRNAGIQDLVTCNGSANTVSVLLGKGDGTFQVPHAYAAGNYPYAVAVGDFTGDGKLDIVVADFYSSSVSVLCGNGDGAFQAPITSSLPSLYPTALAVGDMNHDGKLDVVVTGWSTTNNSAAYVDVLLGNGQGGFTVASTTALPSNRPQHLALADFNGDGNLDVAVTNGGSDTVSVLLGSGNGTVKQPTNIVLGATPSSLAVGDVNGDGKADLVVTEQVTAASSGLAVLLGNGDGSFKAPADITLPVWTPPGYNGGTLAAQVPEAVVVGDVNGDGKLDLAVTASSTYYTGNGSGYYYLPASDYAVTTPNVNVLLGHGDGTFTDSQIVPLDYSGSGPPSILAGDFNSDGLPDLAVPGVAVLMNAANWSWQASNFAVSGFPSSTMAGVPGSFTVTAQNADGSTDTAYAGTVHFSSSDIQAGLPADYTFQPSDAGTHTFSATLKTAGTQSLTVTDRTAAGSDTSITVTPASAATLSLSGFPSPSAAGVSGSFTIVARDAYGNIATGYGGTLHFTSSDASAVLPADATLTNGEGSCSATLNTLGTQSITATDTANASLTGSEGNIQVVPLTLVLSGVPSPTSAGIGEDITVTAEDPAGDIITNYTGTIILSSSDPAATFTDAYTGSPLTGNRYTFSPYDYGTHDFTATLNTVGYQSITVTDSVNASATASQTGIQVVPLASITGPTTGILNQPPTFTLGATGDPAGTVFSYTINWMDGSGLQTITGPSGTNISHAYTTAGSYQPSVTATDPNGFASVSAFTDIVIVPISVKTQIDPANTSRQMLSIADSGTGSDDIVLYAGANNGVTVYVDGDYGGNFTPTNGQPFALVIASAGSGNDVIDARNLAISTVLVGGPGHDTLYGGSARNLLTGGYVEYAGSAGDILIGGHTKYDPNATALAYLMAEWDRTDVSYSTRVKHLSGSLSGGLNGSYDLNSATVLDDNVADTLYGGAGTDWFFAHLSGTNTNKDKVVGKTTGEVVTGI